MQKKKRTALLPLAALILLFNNFGCLSANSQTNQSNQQSNTYRLRTNPYKQQPRPYRSIPARQARTPSYVDDTIIIHTRPGGDTEEVRSILDEVNGTVIKTLHINPFNYDILYVKPYKGNADETIKKLRDKKDKNIRSIRRNPTVVPLQAVPNDPQYPSQWDLPDIDWLNVYATRAGQQVATPYQIVLDTGCNLTTTSNELVNVTQIDGANDTTNSSATPSFTQEPCSDNQGHGTLICNTIGAATNNQYLDCGVGSLQPGTPMKITMFRIWSAANPNPSNADIIDSLAYIVNNASSFPPCPISISWGGLGTYLWEFLDEEAQSLQTLGFQVFIAAGNYGGSDANYVGSYHSIVIMASDSTDSLTSFSSVTIDTPYAAPGVNVPEAGAVWSGTSCSTPVFAACTAVVQSFVSGLSARDAAKYLCQNCKIAGQTNPSFPSTTYGKMLAIPDLNKAIGVAQSLPPPPVIVPTTPSPTTLSPSSSTPSPPPSSSTPSPSPPSSRGKKSAKKKTTKKKTVKKVAKKAVQKTAKK